MLNRARSGLDELSWFVRSRLGLVAHLYSQEYGRWDYLNRFGHATCTWPNEGEHAYMVEPVRAGLYELPDEVVDAGSVQLTGIMHPRSCWSLTTIHSSSAAWFRLERDLWPEESGGPVAADRIADRVEALATGASEIEPMRDPVDRHYRDGDAVLEQLTRPERNRQLRAIAAALERVSDLVS